MNIFESNSFASANQDTSHDDAHHRPIELQSPQDLTYLTNNLSHLATTKLNLHFPPPTSPTRRDAHQTQPSTLQTTGRTTTVPNNDDDDMRRQVSSHVDTYITEVFRLAKQNLSINGLTGEEMELSLKEGEETEDFDHGLAKRVQGLSGEIERLRMELAGIRRREPERLKKGWEEGFERRLEGDERREVERVEKEVGEAKGTVLRVREVERLDEVRTNWETGVERLEAVKGGIGGTVERVERAKRTVDAIEGATG